MHGYHDTMDTYTYKKGGDIERMKKNTGNECEDCHCGGHCVGHDDTATAMVHWVAGVGFGFLIAGYFTLPNIIIWGWVLCVVGILGHFVKGKLW